MNCYPNATIFKIGKQKTQQLKKYSMELTKNGCNQL